MGVPKGPDPGPPEPRRVLESAEVCPNSAGRRRAIVLHPNSPAAYPPLLHLMNVLLEKAWSLQLIGGAGADGLALPPELARRIEVIDIGRSRPGAGRLRRALRLVLALPAVLRRRPHLLLASDPDAAGPALMAAAAGIPVVYIEHDSPCPDPLREGRPLRRLLRRILLDTAALRVFPNAARLAFVQGEAGFPVADAVVLPNLPAAPKASHSRRNEDRVSRRLHFHGSISPMALPLALVPALASRPEWALDLYGYAVGHQAHLDALLAAAEDAGLGPRLRFHGALPNARLHEMLIQADAAFAGFRPHPFNLNHTLIDGASNKLNEYAWHGLPTLVPDDVPLDQFPAALAIPYQREDPQSIAVALDEAARRAPDLRWRPPDFATVCRERLLPRLEALVGGA